MDSLAGSSSCAPRRSLHASQGAADVVTEGYDGDESRLHGARAVRQHQEDEAAAGSSSGARARLRSVPIFVQAFQEDAGSSHAGAESIDCDVEVVVGLPGQQPPLKGAAAQAAGAGSDDGEPPAPQHAQRPSSSSSRRGRAQCCALALLIVGLVVAGVLVPIAVTVGFKTDIQPVFRILPPPPPAPRLILAFEGGALVRAPGDALPSHLADRVLSWSVLPSSGLHIATLSDASALHQVHAALTTAQSPAGNSSSGGGSSTAPSLRYALSDFQLLPDRRLTHLVDPIELFEQSKVQPQQQQQAQQQKGQDVFLMRGHKQQQQQQRRRALLQDGGAAAPPVRPLQLQPQQRQAQYQVQRGAGGVAWHLLDAGLALRDAWNVTSGLDRVVVAVLDSGVELAHGGVGPATWANAAEAAADGVDNDGNGFVDDVMGWDFGGSCADAACSRCLPSEDPTDTAGWGTHAAGVVAGQPEVGAGTAGVAPGVRVMALKVAECRPGAQLWDVLAQQHDKRAGGTPTDQAAQQQRLQDGAGPLLLGSAALQALDYSLLNGAHIVLAGWQAGAQLQLGGSSDADGSGSSSPVNATCFVSGAEDGAASTAQAGAGCVAAAQRLLFADALAPLQQAGVLVVTMQGSSPDPEQPPPLPCSMACELDNVLCVAAAASPAGLEATASKDDGSSTSSVPTIANGLSSAVSAQEFFAPLITPAGTTVTGGSGRGISASSGGGAVAGGSRLEAAQCGGGGSWAQLSAPGTDILATWAWGAHAAVSGGSAAASVVAGAAALAWSQLGQELGADASAAALEGLAPAVKQMLLQGGRLATDSSSSSPETARRADLELPVAQFEQEEHEQVQQADDDASVTLLVGGRSGDATPAAAAASAAALRPPRALNILGSLAHASTAAMRGGQPATRSDGAGAALSLQPVLLPPSSTTLACRCLRHTWLISNEDSGRFDTNSMWFVSRKAVPADRAFPITAWEFSGATSLVELSGYLAVAAAGRAHIAVLAGDGFGLWLQDKRLPLVRARDAGADALPPTAWLAPVDFAAPGHYKLRVTVYAPRQPFDLQWAPPGGSGDGHYHSVTQLLSFGSEQPLPTQLLHSALLPLASRADSTSELGLGPAARTVAAAVAAKQRAAAMKAASATKAAAHGSQQGANAQPPAPAAQARTGGAVSTDLPVSPGGSSNEAIAAASSDSSSTTASLEPSEEDAGDTQQALAADVTDDEAAAASSYSQFPLSFGGGMPGGGGGWAPPFASAMRPQQQPGSVGGQGALSGGYGSGDMDSLLASLRGMFGGFLGRRRRLLLAAAPPHARALEGAGADDRGSSASATGSSLAATQLLQQEAAHYDRRHRRRLAQADTGGGSSSTQWGRFSLAMSFAERTPYRTLMPPLGQLTFTHTGVLPAPAGLSVTAPMQLQQEVLGYSDPADNRGAFGMVQGWLDWRDLNAAALPAAATPAAAAPHVAASPPAATVALIAAEVGSATPAALRVGTAGAQFELLCDSCSLHLDGMAVAGSMGSPAASACITPVQPASSQHHQQRRLVHLQVLFTSNDVRGTKFQVRSRPCSTGASDGGAWSPLVAAAATSPPAFGLSAAAAAADTDAPGRGERHLRGMLCSLTADLTGEQGSIPAAAAAGANRTRDGPSAASKAVGAAAGAQQDLQRVVFLSADELRAAVQLAPAAANNSNDAAAVTPAVASVVAAGAQQVPRRAAVRVRSTVDTPGSDPLEEAGSSSSSSNGSRSGTDSTSGGDDDDDDDDARPPTPEQLEEEAAYAEAQRRRAEQVAAARAAAMARGISIAGLAPDWVADLPPSTRYSLSCACYWNGSWPGNVSVGLTSVPGAVPGAAAAPQALAAASSSGPSSGSAQLFLAGWPLAARPLDRVLYGPSDLDVSAYSSWLQRQQLQSGSASADPLTDGAQLWAAGLLSSARQPGSGGANEQGGLAFAHLARDAGASDAAVLPAAAVAAYRQLRLQAAAAGRSGSNGRAGPSGGSSSIAAGLLPVGSVDGVRRREVLPLPGWMQLLVVQASGLSRDGQVVVLAPGDGSAVSGAGSSLAHQQESSWLPGAWDAWVPAA